MNHSLLCWVTLLVLKQIISFSWMHSIALVFIPWSPKGKIPFHSSTCFMLYHTDWQEWLWLKDKINQNFVSQIRPGFSSNVHCLSSPCRTPLREGLFLSLSSPSCFWLKKKKTKKKKRVSTSDILKVDAKSWGYYTVRTFPGLWNNFPTNLK